jgi:hypothetical protein
MSNIIPFDSTSAAGTAVAEVPAHLVALFGDSANITPRFSINQLSYRGKTWRRVVDGEEVALTRTDAATGDIEPLPIVNLVVLDHNKGRSRAFYAGSFEEGKNTAPDCYSGDGVTPDASVKEPCAATCATCPNAVKGSKITEAGKQVTACSPFKRVAVIPSANIGQHPAMLLRLAQTSVWDKDNPEEAKGWYAWDQYLDMLRARGAKHTAVVETRAKFDMSKAYPKLLFSASRWLNPEEATAVKAELAKQEKDITDILTGAPDRDGMAAGAPASGAASPAVAPAEAAAAVAAAAVAKAQAPAPAAAKPAAPKPPAKPAATQAPAAPKVKKMTAKAGDFTYEQLLGEGWDDESLIAEGMMELVAAAAPKPPAKPTAPKPPTKPKAAPTEADAFAAAPAAAAPATANTTPAPATVVTDTPAGLSDLLAGWDDDAAT